MCMWQRNVPYIEVVLIDRCIEIVIVMLTGGECIIWLRNVP